MAVRAVSPGHDEWTDYSSACSMEEAMSFVEQCLRQLALSGAGPRAKSSTLGQHQVVATLMAPSASQRRGLAWGRALFREWLPPHSKLILMAPRSEGVGAPIALATGLVSAARVALANASGSISADAPALVLVPLLESARQGILGVGRPSASMPGPGAVLELASDSRSGERWLGRDGAAPSGTAVHQWFQAKVRGGAPLSSRAKPDTGVLSASWAMPAYSLMHQGALREGEVTGRAAAALPSTPAWQREVAGCTPSWQCAALLANPTAAWVTREWGRLVMAAEGEVPHVWGSVRCPLAALSLHAAWPATSMGTGEEEGHPLHGSGNDMRPLLTPSLHSAAALTFTAVWAPGSSVQRAAAGEPPTEGGSASAAATEGSDAGEVWQLPEIVCIPTPLPSLSLALPSQTGHVTDAAQAYLLSCTVTDAERAVAVCPSPATGDSPWGGVSMVDVAVAAEAELAPQDRRAYVQARQLTGASGGSSGNFDTLQAVESALEPGGTGSTPSAVRLSRAVGTALGSVGRTLAAAAAGAAMLPPAVRLQRLVDEVFSPGRVGQGPLAGVGGGVQQGAMSHAAIPKTAPPMSLLARVALASAALPGLSSVAVLWRMVVGALRAHWEAAQALPHMPAGQAATGALPPHPDPTSCLLHQKLQLLQLCIHHRAAARASHDMAVPGSPVGSQGGDGQADGSGWDTDLDSSSCSTQGGEEDSGGWADGDAGASDSPACTGQGKAGGGPARHGSLGAIPGMFLCQAPSLPMHTPATLPDAAQYQTEDCLLQQAAMLARLGSDEGGSRVRAQLQTSGLRSDMSAFKAANPGAILADFVRWHSPKDWIGDTSTLPPGTPAPDADAPVPSSISALCTGGSLSERMAQSEAHPWHTTWADAPAQAATAQPAPVDITRAAEQALQYCETVPPPDLVLQLGVVQAAASAWCLGQVWEGLQPPADEPSSPAAEVTRTIIQGMQQALEGSIQRAAASAGDVALATAMHGVDGMGPGTQGPEACTAALEAQTSSALHAKGLLSHTVDLLADLETVMARGAALAAACAPHWEGSGWLPEPVWPLLHPAHGYPYILTEPAVQWGMLRSWCRGAEDGAPLPEGPVAAEEWVALQVATAQRRRRFLWHECPACTVTVLGSEEGWGAAVALATSTSVAALSAQPGQHWAQPSEVQYAFTCSQPRTVTGNPALGPPPLPVQASHRVTLTLRDAEAAVKVLQVCRAGDAQARVALGLESSGSVSHMSEPAPQSLNAVHVALVLGQWLA